MKHANWPLGCLLAASCLMSTAQASRRPPEGVTVPAWDQLSSQQRLDLSAFAERWDRLPASRRVLILERYKRWENLPEPRREALREGARNFRQMSPGQRLKMRRSMAMVRALPEDQRRRLRQLWRSMTPLQRRAWLDRGGPGVSPPPQSREP